LLFSLENSLPPQCDPTSPTHSHGGYLTTQSPISTETIECPLCLGEGHLKRTEVLDRLGVRDFARVAQLSAEEAFRLLLSKHKQEEQSVWARFEAELAATWLNHHGLKINGEEKKDKNEC
jgi:hypothetical protein